MLGIYLTLTFFTNEMCSDHIFMRIYLSTRESLFDQCGRIIKLNQFSDGNRFDSYR